MEWTVTGDGGGSGPVVNEMLLHDVYDLPREVLRGAGRRWDFSTLSCPRCGGTGDRFETIRHEAGCPRDRSPDPS